MSDARHAKQTSNSTRQSSINQSINEKTSRSQFSQQPVYGSVKTQQDKKEMVIKRENRGVKSLDRR